MLWVLLYVHTVVTSSHCNECQDACDHTLPKEQHWTTAPACLLVCVPEESVALLPPLFSVVYFHSLTACTHTATDAPRPPSSLAVFAHPPSLSMHPITHYTSLPNGFNADAICAVTCSEMVGFCCCVASETNQLYILESLGIYVVIYLSATFYAIASCSQPTTKLKLQPTNKAQQSKVMASSTPTTTPTTRIDDAGSVISLASVPAAESKLPCSHLARVNGGVPPTQAAIAKLCEALDQCTSCGKPYLNWICFECMQVSLAG